ncbi:hypothetical protein EQG49_03395 [Periweissella cryptocerci]|uniref:Uncharacterized protein n=1 Tax=Periweissella cryptocerci TaxID=2506420 RepID=A0A4P6YSA7_9LACO|nr:hypothetical protein [Periweissella cryptocerci]QBO35569.1 hypothetical protein EQG49_03395 [Periweissella cryptocerci]
MADPILFNPADSIGKFHDHNEAVSKAQVIKEKHQQTDDELVIAKNAKNEEFFVFYAKDAKKEPHDTDDTQAFEVTKKI